MSQAAEQTRVPSRPELVDEALKRFDVAGVRSQLLDLDTQTLRDLGLRLTDRKVTVSQAWKWLNGELGGTDEEPAVDDNAVYRFTNHFRRLFSQVRAEHARRVARLSVADATDENIGQMTRLAQHRLVELTAEKLVEADNFEDLDNKQINAVMFAVKFAQEHQENAEKIELKRQEAESKAEKRAEEVRVLRQKIDGLPDRIKRLEGRLKEAEAAVEGGKTVDRTLFASIRQELTALAEQTQQPSEDKGGAA